MKIIKSIKAVLSTLDLYSEHIKFNYKGKQAYSTWCGICISLILWVILMATFALLLQELLNRSSPNILLKTSSTLKIKQTSLSADDFFFGFLIQDKDGQNIKDPQSVYTYSLDHCLYDYSSDSKQEENCKSLKMVPCVEANLDDEMVVALSEIMDGICLDQDEFKSKGKDVYLKGLASREKFSLIKFELGLCQGDGCQSEKEIIDLLEGGYLYQGEFIQFIDQSRPGNPYEPIIDIKYVGLSTKLTKVVDQKLIPSFFTDTINYFYYAPIEEQYQGFLTDRRESQDIARPEGNPQLILQQFQLSETSQHFYRSYATIFDIFGNVAGIYQILVLVLGFVVQPLSKLAFHLSAVQGLFQFTDSSQNYQPQVIPLSQISNYDSNQVSTVDKARLKQLFQQKTKKLRIGKCQYLSLIFGRKIPAFDRAVVRMEASLDITKILERLLEIEKLKHILLNQNQLNVFGYLHKPTIKHQHDYENSNAPERIDYSVSHKQFAQQLRNAMNSYKILRSSSNQIDQHLIAMLHPEIVDKLEESLPRGPDLSVNIQTITKLKEVDHIEEQSVFGQY